MDVEETELFLPNFVLGPEIANQLSHPLGESEGLLVGRRRIRRTLILTDQQEATEKLDPILCVDAFYPGNLFQALRLDSKQERQIDMKGLGWLKPGERIVGWYRFARECRFEPSFHEWLIHRKLVMACQSHLAASPDRIVFLMFGTSRDEKGTLQHSSHALRFDSKKFVGVRSFMFEPERPSIIGCYRGGPAEYPGSLLETSSAYLGPSKAVASVLEETDGIYHDIMDNARQLVVQLEGLHNSMKPTRRSDLPENIDWPCEAVIVSPLGGHQQTHLMSSDKKVNPAPLLEAIESQEEEVRRLGLDRKKENKEESEPEDQDHGQKEEDAENPDDEYFDSLFQIHSEGSSEKPGKRGGKRSYSGRRGAGGGNSRGKRGRRSGTGGEVQSFFKS